MTLLSLNDIFVLPFKVAWLCGVVLSVECSCECAKEISGLVNDLCSGVLFTV